MLPGLHDQLLDEAGLELTIRESQDLVVVLFGDT
jgi:hypothetical protein